MCFLGRRLSPIIENQRFKQHFKIQRPNIYATFPHKCADTAFKSQR